MTPSICVRQSRVNLRGRRAPPAPRRNTPCPSCDSRDTFVYDDPEDGPELVCFECVRYSIAAVIEGD